MNINAPIIVGGVGGSGTRLIASILEHLDIYMGSFQNSSNDNLYFAHLVSAHFSLWKRPPSALRLRLDAFTRLYFGKPLTPRHLLCIIASAPTRYKRCLSMIRHSRNTRMLNHAIEAWGFKNPRTLYFLPHLKNYYPECRYIHVIRHGLDMAFSTNTNQACTWGADFGIPCSKETITPIQQLEFWITVNKWALTQCQQLFPEQHYVLNFDRLCRFPEQELEKLIAFLGVKSSTSASDLKKLCNIPVSTGRYKAKLSMFTPEHIQSVREFGFEV